MEVISSTGGGLRAHLGSAPAAIHKHLRRELSAGLRRHRARRRRPRRARALPGFVKAELEGFATCGDFEKGFVRTACRTCGDELLVPFACKSRDSPIDLARDGGDGAEVVVEDRGR